MPLKGFTATQIESIFSIFIFVFMILHRTYLGRHPSLSLVPITLLSLPLFFSFIAGLKINRRKWGSLLLISAFIFYTGLRIYRGNANLFHEGDRDDALVGMAHLVINGDAKFPFYTFIGLPATSGPTSTVLSLPFVYFFGSNNWLSWVFFVSLLFYFYRKLRQPDGALGVGLAIGTLVFLPYLNWCYWEASEELLYGWAFLLPATSVVLMFLENKTSSIRLPVFAGVLAGLAVGARISYAVPFFYLIMVVIFYSKWREALVMGLCSLFSFALISLPLIFRSSFDEYVYHWLIPVWLQSNGSGPVRTSLLLSIIALVAFLTKKFRINVRLGIVIATAVSYIWVGYFLVKWQFYFWAFPAIVWLHEIIPSKIKRSIVNSSN